MFFKVVIFAAVLVAVNAHYIGQSHGPAVSSQTIIRYDESHDQHHHATPYHYSFAVIHPIVHHAAPEVHHAPIHHIANDDSHNSHDSHDSHDDNDYYAHPKYDYEYQIKNPHTGDIKSHQESRDGDHVTGSYSLHQPDGAVRTVHYNADKHSGFNAQVEYSHSLKYFQPAHHGDHYDY